MTTVIYLGAALTYVLTAGIAFRGWFEKNRVLAAVTGLVAAVSTVFVVGDAHERILAPIWDHVAPHLWSTGIEPPEPAALRTPPSIPTVAAPTVAVPTAVPTRFATPACPGASAPARLTLGPGRVPVNAGACRMVFVIAEGEVIFDTDRGEKRYDASDVWTARFRIGSVRSVRAGGERAVLDYALCPMDGAAEVNWDCSPKEP